MALRILHVLDHSIPLHSGYTFRTLAILREQRRLGWETFHLTSPSRHGCAAPRRTSTAGTSTARAAATRVATCPVVGDAQADAPRTSAGSSEVARSVAPDVLHAHSPVLNALPALRVGRQARHSGGLRGARILGRRRRRPRHDDARAACATG